MISVAHEEGNLNDLRAILGNDIAYKAAQNKALPYPRWRDHCARGVEIYSFRGKQQILGREQSFVAGSPTNVQLMVKDSTKYATTGGWGFAQFNESKPADETIHSTCFSCHEPVKARDFVFTRYAP